MEKMPLMRNMNTRILTQPSNFQENSNEIPMYCSQISCKDPQIDLRKCLENGDITRFSSILAEQTDVNDDISNRQVLPNEHWLNCKLYEDDRNILQLALEKEPLGSSLPFINKLIDAGVCADFFNSETDLALIHVAIKTRELAKVEALLDTPWNKADISVTTQPEGLSSLHLAVQHPNILKRLLREPKARVNSKDNCGSRTPLQLAIQTRNRESAILLVENGANLDEIVNGKDLRSQLQTTFRDLDINSISVRRKPVYYSLDIASDFLDKRELAVFKSAVGFLEKSEISEGVVRGGVTLLQRASIEGLNDFVQALLHHGANPNVGTKENSRPPTLLAAERGHCAVLQSLLYSGKVILPSWTQDTQETLLHVILKKSVKSNHYESNYENCLNIVLDNEDFASKIKPVINKKDDLGNTPLYYAAKSWSQKVVQQLLELGANIGIRNIRGEVPLSRIQAETFENFLNTHCIQTTKDPDEYSDSFEVTFHYDFLAPPVTEEQLQNWDQEKQSALDLEALPETDSLWYLAQSKTHRHLIKHPVLTSFMWLKWQRIRRLFNRNLRFYMLFVVILTWYIFARFGGKSLGIRNESEDFCSDLKLGETYYGFFYVLFAIHCVVQIGFILSDWFKDYYTDGLKSCLLGSWLEIFTFFIFAIILYGSLGILKWVLVALLILMSLRESFQMISSFKRYLLSMENWMEVILIVMLSIVLFGDEKLINCDWSRHLSAIALLISWAELITMVGRHPKLSRYNIYVTMFYKVLESFFFFLIWFSFFIIAFAFGFYIMLHRDNGTPVKSDYEFFDSPGLSLAKTFTMFVGEIEFSDIPVDISNDGTKSSVLPVMAYVFLLAFLFFIVVVLMNLLNGLAITDTGHIHARAEIVSNVTRVESVSYAESVLLGDPFDFLTSPSYKESSWLSKNIPSCALLNAIYSKSPTVRLAFQKFTGATGILLFFTLLPDKTASFPSVAKSLLGGRTNAEIHDLLEKTKDIVRKRKEEEVRVEEKTSIQYLISSQKTIMETLQHQREEIKALSKKLSL